jgi:metallophosphoesterase (TIGR00282 family)
MVKVLFLGDIIGKPGRNIVNEILPQITKEHDIDLVLGNAENSAGGLGVTPETLQSLRKTGINGFTLGNHIWRYDSIVSSLENDTDVVKPANLPPATPGKNFMVLTARNGVKVGIVSLLGRVFMEPVDCPFRRGEEVINEISKETHVIIVDIHAEATAEKIALAWYLDGKCSAILGTHTHVQTADEWILPSGTAYISDVGMCGPYHSVIGMEVSRVLTRFLTGIPKKWEVANGPAVFNAVLLEIDEKNGKAHKIERVMIKKPDSM